MHAYIRPGPQIHTDMHTHTQVYTNKHTNAQADNHARHSLIYTWPHLQGGECFLERVGSWRKPWGGCVKNNFFCFWNYICRRKFFILLYFFIKIMKGKQTKMSVGGTLWMWQSNQTPNGLLRAAKKKTEGFILCLFVYFLFLF